MHDLKAPPESVQHDPSGVRGPRRVLRQEARVPLAEAARRVELAEVLAGCLPGPRAVDPNNTSVLRIRPVPLEARVVLPEPLRGVVQYGPALIERVPYEARSGRQLRLAQDVPAEVTNLGRRIERAGLESLLARDLRERLR